MPIQGGAKRGQRLLDLEGELCLKGGRFLKSAMASVIFNEVERPSIDVV